MLGRVLFNKSYKFQSGLAKCLYRIHPPLADDPDTRAANHAHNEAQRVASLANKRAKAMKAGEQLAKERRWRAQEKRRKELEAQGLEFDTPSMVSSSEEEVEEEEEVSNGPVVVLDDDTGEGDGVPVSRGGVPFMAPVLSLAATVVSSVPGSSGGILTGDGASREDSGSASAGVG